MHIMCLDLTFTPSPPVPIPVHHPPSLLLPSLPACPSSLPFLFPLPLPCFPALPTACAGHPLEHGQPLGSPSWQFTLSPSSLLLPMAPPIALGLHEPLPHCWNLILYTMAWFYTVPVQLRLSIYYILIFPSQLIPDPPYFSTHLTLCSFSLSTKQNKTIKM